MSLRWVMVCGWVVGCRVIFMSNPTLSWGCNNISTMYPLAIYPAVYSWTLSILLCLHCLPFSIHHCEYKQWSLASIQYLKGSIPPVFQKVGLLTYNYAREQIIRGFNLVWAQHQDKTKQAGAELCQAQASLNMNLILGFWFFSFGNLGFVSLVWFGRLDLVGLIWLSRLGLDWFAVVFHFWGLLFAKLSFNFNYNLVESWD